jgi:hypothetical protein
VLIAFDVALPLIVSGTTSFQEAARECEEQYLQLRRRNPILEDQIAGTTCVLYM